MLLKVGSSGDDVKKMQVKLGIGADGVFGPGTERAVKDWQSAHGLTADGIVGPGTWAKMFPEVVAATVVDAAIASLDTAKLGGQIPDEVIAQLPDCETKFQINSALRLAHFLAQCGHESSGFKSTRENLNYSAEGLKKVFPKYFPDDLADSYARQPDKIASRVYANRMGNGDEASREGYQYRGRGYIQLTGKNNYSEFGRAIGEDILSNPDIVADKYPLLSAAWFWNAKSLNSSADKGSGDDVVTEITKKINGGLIGYDDRLARFKALYALLT